MDAEAIKRIVVEEWDAAIPALQEFVRIPNLTTSKDAEWESNGLLDKAVSHMVEWIEAQKVEGCKMEVHKDPGFSPFLYVEIAGTTGSPKAANSWVMYTHLDKQPWGAGWDEDIAPTGALIRDGKMYGRGSADDGYGLFACVIAVKALQRQGVAHPRMVIFSETSEESGSPHLAHYVEKLSPRIGTPTAVYCLDSMAKDYTTFWMTTSLRGAIAAVLTVSAVKQSLHSGSYGGMVPCAHRLTRQLLGRVEDVATGRLLLPELFTKVPVERQQQMKDLVAAIGRPDLHMMVRWQPGAHPVDGMDPYALEKANVWEPSLAVIGQEGLPELAAASPALQPVLKTMMAVRLPPLVDPEAAAKALKEAFEKDPPCGASVELDVRFAVGGWHSPELKPNLSSAVSQASKAVFDGREPGYSGEGGTIPLMKMLGDMFPEASLVVCGVLGPGANEHGPNENLDLEYTKKFTACVSMIMGLLEPESDAWPDDVPRPAAEATARRKPQFCFADPKVRIGDCLCCI